MTTLDPKEIVFVYGALRSGTTVFRLMLDAHPKIANPGEMDFLFDFIHPDQTHPTGWRYDVEALKQNRIFQVHGATIPDGIDGLDLMQSILDELHAAHQGMILSINIHRHVDKIIAIMPGVRIIHMVRDPRDVACSSIVMGWAGTPYHGVGHWIETETAWSASMDAVSVSPGFELQYETLLAKPEETLQDICAFLSTPFDQKMMSYYHGTTYSAPDASRVQPWRRTKYSERDMALVETRAGHLMQSRGYPPELPPAQFNAFSKAYLIARNKLAVWKFGINRYGFPVFFGEKITRKIGLSKARNRLKQDMNRIDQSLVK